SDIYSFGILMWEISSGHPPFENKFNNNQDLINAITCHETREIFIANTPEDYEKLYKKCWKQEPEQRPIIKEVLKIFNKMDFGKIIGDNETTKDTENNNSDPDSKIGDSIQLDTFENLS
ncbi:18986_t:CDS:2, partial [Funneliformis geosporum]